MFKSKAEKQAKKLAKQQAKQAEREENLRKANEFYERRTAEIKQASAERKIKNDLFAEKVGKKASDFVEKAGNKLADGVESVGTGVAQKIIDFGNAGLDRVYTNFETYLKTDHPHYYKEISQIEDINEKRKRMDEIDKLLSGRK
ncbi:MAG: hypothetical protein FWG67_00570 [Defluviitaleaceae bacterium]|nr:hypothetical protein [Defluviitaleaceae bacterium]